MLKRLTRLRLIQVWFMVIALAAAIGLALGGVPTLQTAILLLVLSLVPPAIVLALWPGLPVPTASEIMHGVDRR